MSTVNCSVDLLGKFLVGLNSDASHAFGKGETETSGTWKLTFPMHFAGVGSAA